MDAICMKWYINKAENVKFKWESRWEAMILFKCLLKYNKIVSIAWEKKNSNKKTNVTFSARALLLNKLFIQKGKKMLFRIIATSDDNLYFIFNLFNLRTKWCIFGLFYYANLNNESNICPKTNASIGYNNYQQIFLLN